MEIWKSVNLKINLKFEVEISNKGNIRKYVDGNIINLKPSINSRGYLSIYLRCHDSRPQYTIHRLVGLTFLSDSINEVINHKDGDKLNNNVENIEWTTRKENTRHGKLIKNKKRIIDLKDDDILNIINEYLTLEITLVSLAEKWGIERETMRTIISFRSKKILSEEEYTKLRNRHIVIRCSKANKNLEK